LMIWVGLIFFCVNMLELLLLPNALLPPSFILLIGVRADVDRTLEIGR
jgi:hypothetical protein